MPKVKYRKEFFDRDYTVREAYRRVWKYARKYRFRLAIGIICGMMTATALVPFFQIVQPVLQYVESHDDRVEKGAKKDDAIRIQQPSSTKPATASVNKNAFEKEIARNSKLPGWYPKVERIAAKCGIRLQDEKGGMGGALALIVCVIVLPDVQSPMIAWMYVLDVMSCVIS